MSGHFKPNPLPFVALTYKHILRKKEELLAAIESHRAAIEKAKQRLNMPTDIRQMNSEITYKNKEEKKTIKGIIEFSLDKIKGLKYEQMDHNFLYIVFSLRAPMRPPTVES
jgi:hypothetical protein